MKEHTKIYSNELILDGIYGVIDSFNNKNKGINKANVQIEKNNNDLYVLKLYVNNKLILNVCNTIDCLYYYVKGYLLCICDSKEFNIIQ